MIEHLKVYVEKLATTECDKGIFEYKLFHSAHEAQNVIKEEVEECKDELDMIFTYLEAMWKAVKVDNDRAVAANAILIKRNAISLACEAIQVAAMAEKYIKSIEEDK